MMPSKYSNTTEGVMNLIYSSFFIVSSSVLAYKWSAFFRNIGRGSKIALISAIAFDPAHIVVSARDTRTPPTIERLAPVSATSDDFWYPTFMIGTWETQLTFRSASFKSNEIMADTSGSLPGHNKFSIGFLPIIGKDANTMLRRYVQVDSHPREDHSFNVRNLMTAFEPSITVQDASYSYQKAPNWLHAPANKWTVKFQDNCGMGAIKLTTMKRSIRQAAGVVQTTEHFHQVLSRSPEHGSMINANKEQSSRSDFAVRWTLAPTPSDESQGSLTASQLAKVPTVTGTLEVLAYYSPTSDMYFKAPGVPAAVYTYDVRMKRLTEDGSILPKSYPYVPREAGPVELDRYFGY